MKRFYSHGKLLLTAEYLVLDGALALAIPTRFGQYLTVEKDKSKHLKWTSYNHQNSVWFETKFILEKNGILRCDDTKSPITERLLDLLLKAKTLNPDFLGGNHGYHIKTELEFPENWGLGTSSTLVNNIAMWAKVDAYDLLEATFGGSGYDIACANSGGSLTYQLLHKIGISDATQSTVERSITNVDFNPSFKNHIYFVHLNQKQNSRKAIALYRNNKRELSDSISEINTITKKMIACDNIRDFQELMQDHEMIISRILGTETVKENLFGSFEGSVKSLGAWGGDFIMVASNEDPTHYFTHKGFNTILSYSEMLGY